jgi:hypothetical protein
MKASMLTTIGLMTAFFLMTAPAMAMHHEGKDAKAAPAKKGPGKASMLMENEKVQVLEIRLKPGDEYKAEASASSRVIRALRGGTLKRTDPDGKTQDVEWKTGQVRFFDKVASHSAKNIGKSDLHFYIVVLK